jgi:hypothetical protein
MRRGIPGIMDLPKAPHTVTLALPFVVNYNSVKLELILWLDYDLELSLELVENLAEEIRDYMVQHADKRLSALFLRKQVIVEGLLNLHYGILRNLNDVQFFLDNSKFELHKNTGEVSFSGKGNYQNPSINFTPRMQDSELVVSFENSSLFYVSPALLNQICAQDMVNLVAQKVIPRLQADVDFIQHTINSTKQRMK